MIDVWCSPGLAIAPHALGDDELARADRFLCARTAATYRAAHTLMRRVLSHYRPACAPADWRFTTNPWGKPAAAAPMPAPAFNLSHSGDCIAIAVSDCEVGVDIEHVRPMPQFDEVARYVFHPDELRWRARQPDPLRAFFRLWTLKEALLKATGTGFSHPPRELSWHALDAPWSTAEFEGRTWLGATRAIDGAILSVAVPLGSDVDDARLLTLRTGRPAVPDAATTDDLVAIPGPFLAARH